MKEKIRKIWVDEQEYFWAISPVDSNYVCLKIWLSISWKIPWLKIKYGFDNPWIHFGEIITTTPEQIQKYFQLCPLQPRLVAQIIKKVNRSHPVESMKSQETLNYLFNINGKLEVIANVDDVDIDIDAIATFEDKPIADEWQSNILDIKS